MNQILLPLHRCIQSWPTFSKMSPVSFLIHKNCTTAVSLHLGILVESGANSSKVAVSWHVPAHSYEMMLLAHSYMHYIMTQLTNRSSMDKWELDKNRLAFNNVQLPKSAPTSTNFALYSLEARNSTCEPGLCQCEWPLTSGEKSFFQKW